MHLTAIKMQCLSQEPRCQDIGCSEKDIQQFHVYKVREKMGWRNVPQAPGSLSHFAKYCDYQATHSLTHKN